MTGGLPDTIRVRLSSEEAGAISLNQVVVRDLPLRELVEHMLGYTGKDESRVRDLLRRGSLVSGISRFRWQGWDPGPESLREVLASFPDPEPGRPFAAEACPRVVLRGGRAAVEARPESGGRKAADTRGSFWEVLMRLAATAPPAYLDYSYRDRADRYQVSLSARDLKVLRDAAGLVAFTTLRDQLRTQTFVSMDLFVARPGRG
jgi:hypothetical protein